jgi:hypothetical protein
MNWLPEIAMPSLADPTPADQQVGAWGFVIVMALIVGTFLLWLNMRKQLRKINVPSDGEDEIGVPESDPGSATGKGTEPPVEPEGNSTSP